MLAGTPVLKYVPWLLDVGENKNDVEEHVSDIA
jgi:hypothetical protein